MAYRVDILSMGMIPRDNSESLTAMIELIYL
jgi:hypothetical protein